MNRTWVDVPNARTVHGGIVAGGRPTSEHLRQAKAEGLESVIDLCAPCERNDFDEAVVARGLGLHYTAIPISGPADLNRDNAVRLAEALRRAAGKSVLVHCAGGNRAAALLALKAYFVDGLSQEKSVEIGRAAGLSYLEPQLRRALAGL